MTLIADFLLAAGALGAALYCYVLSRRLNRFDNLKDGMGGAVAVLSTQVDEMTKALERARAAAESSSGSLTELTERSENAARRLELLLASLHDLPDPPSQAEEANGRLDETRAEDQPSGDEQTPLVLRRKEMSQ